MFVMAHIQVHLMCSSDLILWPHAALLHRPCDVVTVSHRAASAECVCVCVSPVLCTICSSGSLRSLRLPASPAPSDTLPCQGEGNEEEEALEEAGREGEDKRNSWKSAICSSPPPNFPKSKHQSDALCKRRPVSVSCSSASPAALHGIPRHF